MKLIVIHGWGGTYLEAAQRLLDLLDVESFWYRGNILVPARSATLLRHLLNDPTDDAHYRSLCKLIVSRFLMSPPIPRDRVAQLDHYSRFAEDRLRRDFPQLGIPFAPDARKARASQLAREAEIELQPLLQILTEMRQTATEELGDRDEDTIRQILNQAATNHGCSRSPIPLLEALREMHETGGDLDTVASAALYATALRQQARTQNKPFRYGHEYRFVFVNYHESLHALKALAPAELYLADLPVAAFPTMEQDIKELHENGIHTARFEDHHPYDPARKQALQTLVSEGKLGYLGLSGPEQGAELQEEELKCAADMVFESCIEGTPADHAASRRLRAAAHGEDFVTNRTRLGILLTDLIKGGICKVELAQILLAAMDEDDAMPRLQRRGWADLPALWRATLDSTAETILENTALLQLEDGRTRIICAKAVHAEPGMPKLPTGKAIEFLSRHFPDAHYAFYCFGSALMVARRLDHADTTLNLGSIMPRIGTSTDGGHAGAAVCRPDANAKFPHRLLGHISDANFFSFARYLGFRLTSAGYPVATIRNLSRPGRARWTGGTRKLIWVIAASFLAGLALLAFVPSFRPANIRASNADFLPQIDIGEDAEVAPSLEAL
ncbi:MAG: hypothetical protein ACNA71_05635 [Kiritimatiellia bacterium]